MFRLVLRSTASLAALLFCACVPVTVGNPGGIDFDRYRVAYIESVALRGDVYDALWVRDYFVAELRSESGFEEIVQRAEDDYDVSISLTVDVSYENTGTFDNPNWQYEAHASFTARDTSGAVVKSGFVTDESDWLDEAVEDAVDEVVLEFLRPYRV